MRATLLRRLAAVLCVLVTLTTREAAAEPQFSGYEIRVIRPRYFIKAGHVEAALGAGAIVNQTFVYSFLATGLLTYHMTETLGLEAQLGYGTSIDRADKKTLQQKYAINTILLRPETMTNARLVWTPSYGKFHLSSSRIVYFDTHVTLGAGMTGIRYLYEHCEGSVAPKVAQYPTGVLGIGQRYFLDANSSLRLGFELQRFIAKRGDAACGETTAEPVEGTVSVDDLFLFAAWSVYL